MVVDIEKYKNIKFEKREKCLVCGERVGLPVIDLPDFPMTEIYVDKKVTDKVARLNQQFHVCQKCGHGQIANVIDVGLQYGDAITYAFRTSESSTGRQSVDFFVEFLREVVRNKHFKTIIELGCNDLYLLKSIKDKGKKLVGIDPILKGKEAEFSDDNVQAVGGFFEDININEQIDLVICKDTLEHVDQPKEFVKKIVDKAHNETLFFFQFPFLETLFGGCRFDQIFHQHLNYFSLKSIIYMLADLGCELIDFKINFNHWGAILIAFRKGKDTTKFAKDVQTISDVEILRRYQIFKSNMQATKERLSLLKGENIYGYGAALMLPVLAYHLEMDLSELVCVIDDDERKQGLYYINLPVAIKTRENIGDISDSVVMLTAIASMNNGRRILPKLFKLNPRQVILPLNII